MVRIIIDLEERLEEYVDNYINIGGYDEERKKPLYCYPDRLVKTIKDGIVLSDKITNGEVIKTLFPKLHMYSDFDYWKVDLGEIVVGFDKKWWNSPYKETDHEVKICETCAHYGEDLHGTNCRFCSDQKLWEPKEG